MRISDWSSDVCSSDLAEGSRPSGHRAQRLPPAELRRAGEPRGERTWSLLQNACRDGWRREHPPGLIRCGVGMLARVASAPPRGAEIGRETCRERVCQYVLISGVGVSLIRQTITPISMNLNLIN